MSAFARALNVDRRSFLRTGATAIGGLLIGCYLPERRTLAADTAAPSNKLNAFVLMGNDDTVTFYIHKAEMGQGTVTSLSMLLAEELECDWSKIRTEFPGVDRAYGGFQGVVGSQSIRSSYISLRQAGASAREMLIAAAAQKWGVEKSACRAEKSTVVNTASNARLTYGSLAEAAAKLPQSVESGRPPQRRPPGGLPPPKLNYLDWSPSNPQSARLVTRPWP